MMTNMMAEAMLQHLQVQHLQHFLPLPPLSDEQTFSDFFTPVPACFVDDAEDLLMSYGNCLMGGLALKIDNTLTSITSYIGVNCYKNINEDAECNNIYTLTKDLALLLWMSVHHHCTEDYFPGYQ